MGKMKKIFFVSTENGCNNNCIGCADNNLNKPKKGRDMNKIFKDLELGAEKGYKNLHLAGGEVTIQDNIFDILQKANELYDEIYITSNGRIFSYRSFAKKIVDSGVTQFNITLCGPNQKIHEAWTRTPGSFKQTIKGIKNLRSLTNNICVNYLIWRKSLYKVKNTLLLLKKLGIKHIDFFNLAPLGRGKTYYNQLYAPLKDLLKLEKQVSLFDSFSDIEIEDFPLCVFSDVFMNKSNIHVFDTSGRIYKDEKGNIETYSLFAAKEFNFCINSNLTVQKDIKKMENKFKTYKIKIKECNNCLKKDSCGGIFSDYIKLVGECQIKKEITHLREKQNY